MQTKTQKAVEMVWTGATVREAAREHDVSESAVRMAIKVKRAKSEGVCACCGQKLAIAGSIRQSLAKNPALTLERVLQWLES